MQGRRGHADAIPDTQAAIVRSNIRALRQRRRWSQEKLGELMGWRDKSIVCDAEGRRSGRQRKFTVDEVERLAAIFGISPGQLTTRCANCGGQPPAGFTCLACGTGEAISASGEPPGERDLITAGTSELSSRGVKDASEHGCNLKPGKGRDVQGGPDFHRYWAVFGAPVPDFAPGVVERIAVRQIWPRLAPALRRALAALAVHGDYATAAQALGYPYPAFVSMISKGRTQFLALWHEHEAPSRLWIRDRHGRNPLRHRHRRAEMIPDAQSAVVGANIRVLRQRKGWSLAKLGELIDWPSESTVCAAEGRRSGQQRKFTVDEVERLAAIFGISPGQLTTRCANCGGQPPAGFACLACGTASPKPEPDRSKNQRAGEDPAR
jgi:transcriptional regulator with XRE-family HTH domain